MRTRISKVAAAIGLAVGLAVIGGSVVGGIALASDRSHGATTDTPGPGASQGNTDDDQGDDIDDDADDATDDDMAEDADDGDGDDVAEPEDATQPNPSMSHDDDGPGDDGPGDDD